MGVYGALSYAFLLNPGNIVDIQILNFLQAFNIVVLIASRVPQIYSTFQAKSAGQLALLTWLLNFAGTAARVFTTLSSFRTGVDEMILLSFGLAFFLNGTIVFQILYYGSPQKVQVTVPSAPNKKLKIQKIQ